MPYRAFGPDSDAVRGQSFTAGVISVVFVPSTASQTSLSAAMQAGALEVSIENPATCPATTATQVCGFAAGDHVLVFNGAGEWEVFAVDRIGAGTAIALKGVPPTREFAAGANVTEARAITYALKADSASGAFQLVRSDGLDPAQPLLDHVVKLEFQYFGDAQPPQLIDETETPLRATYGPGPPALDQSVAGWPAGENCTFGVVDAHHQARLAALASSATLVEIPPAILVDGPWCPDAGARNRFDADLLRIRRLRVTLRVQTAVPSLRGPAGILFTNGGLSRSGGRSVPDLEMQLDVTPRNLNLEPGTRNLEHE
jgi:hypothetical protein